MEALQTDSPTESTLAVIGRAVLMGTAVALAGTIPRNIFFALNLRCVANFPWAVPLTGIYLWFFWKYLKGTDERRQLLRASPLRLSVWLWAHAAGLLGIVFLVLALNVANRFVTGASHLWGLGPSATVAALAASGLAMCIAFYGLSRSVRHAS